MENSEYIFNEIIKSKKYHHVNHALIRRIVAEETPKYKKDKLVIKSIKNKLHQCYGAFITPNGNSKTAKLIGNRLYDEILSLHTSTLERKTFYREFYQQIFAVTGTPKRIMDLACGYNPFSIVYMGLPPGFMYYAYDIDEAVAVLLNRFFQQNKYRGLAKTMDLATNSPTEECDVVFILKFLSLMNQQNSKHSLELLLSLKANYLVISFPTKTLTGLNVGMQKSYTGSFNSLIANHFSLIKELIFSNEIVFIIQKKQE